LLTADAAKKLKDLFGAAAEKGLGVFTCVYV
jgi:hypothetical protein